ncbi:hypothetical protein [Candidatus Deianiraea vastatrix]|uniref:NlpC/P60 domain-containing protein n=1 Tax=Candidatus Deianiraea vastatrix TaxID=2163644 RepID=A0A5B8XG78_9RICK|nr:hypothetical protein [Candidatus Deianiraea vastatrix]QED23865.1 hypothetical protein Deia_01084 [Candidatus Deianiraea vastatrix]
MFIDDILKFIGSKYTYFASLGMKYGRKIDEKNFDCIGMIIYSLSQNGFKMEQFSNILSKKMYQNLTIDEIEEITAKLSNMGFKILDKNHEIQNSDILLFHINHLRLHFGVARKKPDSIDIIHANSEVGKVVCENFDMHLKKYLIYIIRLQ